MDSRASVVMANAAGVSPGDAVLDPFAGSGGLLLASARVGAAYTVGVDINSSIDLSKVNSNFRQLNLSIPKAYFFGDIGEASLQVRPSP